MLKNDGAALFEFHVSRAARDRYQFDDTLFATNGEVIFANFHAARVFAQRMNQKRDLVNFPEQAVQPSQLNAMGLIHELTHHTLRAYRQQNPQFLTTMLSTLNARLGEQAVESTLRKFADEFPTVDVYRGKTDIETYLNGTTDNLPNREVVLEEMILLWTANANPAFSPFMELFDDAKLERETAYPLMITQAQHAAGDEPGFGPSGQNIFDLLLAPIRAHPHSLEAQLEYMRQNWGTLIGKYIYRLLSSLDLIKEEGRMFLVGGGGFNGGPFYEPPINPGYGQEGEPENFTPDREWMPRLVMLAKNAYVWLDQLSKKYQRPIRSLAEIPDEELDTLARWGLSGLWLIGLWERSEASKNIKQIMGNQDAVASAYSLYDYQIARALGGEEAAQNLRERAWQRGIRLASDMVPNHVGIDGRWVMQHPDWFVQLDYPPFPSYTFSGPDLSNDDRVGIFLEDHYYSRSDAAVVFKRVDRHSGSEKYIYHGNDGTSMPWNDTAQLNYLNPEVREGVIQTILHVARQFPIIRFDAAMTLAKKHYQRLWFPEPGTGGDIASRADFGLTREQFDQLMPQEFWREVVDRAAVEAPDTLLLAEAFWLMESYFVRTLGMHRVYNSAFMHILRDEENAKYRYLMKNTLEFDPEILKRYVNFMNNPDERTAIDQFGKGDKYFGICTLMITMPGLPMFGHGQVEGFAEKYGMEYQRAYWDERPDQYLIERHEREIFPIVHKRYLFANVDHFLLYDFFTPEGGVNEDVFAYSNRYGDERSLVVYHNKFADARGWIRTSAAYMARTGNGDERRLMQRSLGEGLGLTHGDDRFTIFRDHITGMEYIRSSRELIEQGLYIELGAYKCQVFLDFREVQDDETHKYRNLAAYLNGRGVPSVEDTIRETFLQPIHLPMRDLINADLFQRLTAVVGPEDITDEDLIEVSAGTAYVDEVDELPDIADDLDDIAELEGAALADDEVVGEADMGQEDDELTGAVALADEVETKLATLLKAINAFTNCGGDEQAVVAEVRSKLEAILTLPVTDGTATGVGQLTTNGTSNGHQAAEDGQEVIANSNFAFMIEREDTAKWATIWSWLFLHALGKLSDEQEYAQQSVSWIDEWLLGRVMVRAFSDLGIEEGQTNRLVALVKQLTTYQRWFETPEFDRTYTLLETLLGDTGVQQLLRINRHQGVLWFNKELFEQLLWWMMFLAEVTIRAEQPENGEELRASTIATIQELRRAADASGYQVAKLLEQVQA